jgi:hypothetical protein
VESHGETIPTLRKLLLKKNMLKLKPIQTEDGYTQNGMSYQPSGDVYFVLADMIILKITIVTSISAKQLRR